MKARIKSCRQIDSGYGEKKMKRKRSARQRVSSQSFGSRQIFSELRKHQHILKQLSVRKIGVFGSYAAGRETSKSDIDFVVEFDQPSFDRFMALIDFLEKLFGKKVDVLTREGVETIRARNVAEDIQRTTVYV